MSKDLALEQQAWDSQASDQKAEERRDAELLYKLDFVPVVDILKSKYVKPGN